MQALDNCLRFVTLGLLGRTPTKIAATQYNESRFWELSRDSPKFIQYNLTFKHKLERLYQIEYTGKMARQRKCGYWKGGYFHCTGNCACLESRIRGGMRTVGIRSDLWCHRTDCPIRGILSNGFLIEYCLHGGHYFSDTVDTAKTYGDMKSPSRTLYGIFICDVRRSIKTNTNIFYVNSDKDIQPAYLAIVRRA